MKIDIKEAKEVWEKEIEKGILPNDLNAQTMREFVSLFGPEPLVYLSKMYGGKRPYIITYEELTKESRKRGQTNCSP